MAQTYNLVLVLDMGDKQPCSIANDSNCPSNAQYQYNTQIAINEQGEIIGKYWKNHLFYEYEYNTPNPRDVATFTTSFGITFGMMV